MYSSKKNRRQSSEFLTLFIKLLFHGRWGKKTQFAFSLFRALLPQHFFGFTTTLQMLSYSKTANYFASSLASCGRGGIPEKGSGLERFSHSQWIAYLSVNRVDVLLEIWCEDNLISGTCSTNANRGVNAGPCRYRELLASRCHSRDSGLNHPGGCIMFLRTFVPISWYHPCGLHLFARVAPVNKTGKEVNLDFCPGTTWELNTLPTQLLRTTPFFNDAPWIWYSEGHPVSAFI